MRPVAVPRLALVALTVARAAAAARAQDRAPETMAEAEAMMFGGADDVAYAQLLWEVLTADRMVGPDAVRSYPYEGLPPHGRLLEIYYTRATVNGHTGDLVLKRNYGPEEVTRNQIIADPQTHLDRITLMFRREAGWDPEMQDWFFAEYDADGTITETRNGTPQAGAVGKNLNDGCAACHIAAAGNDFIFTANYPPR